MGKDSLIRWLKVHVSMLLAYFGGFQFVYGGLNSQHGEIKMEIVTLFLKYVQFEYVRYW